MYVRSLYPTSAIRNVIGRTITLPEDFTTSSIRECRNVENRNRFLDPSRLFD